MNFLKSCINYSSKSIICLVSISDRQDPGRKIKSTVGIQQREFTTQNCLNKCWVKWCINREVITVGSPGLREERKEAGHSLPGSLQASPSWVQTLPGSVPSQCRAGAVRSWVQTEEAVLCSGAGLQRKCTETFLGWLKEARGWKQLLLLSDCWLGREMNSKQNRRQSLLPSLGLLGPHW